MEEVKRKGRFVGGRGGVKRAEGRFRVGGGWKGGK